MKNVYKKNRTAKAAALIFLFCSVSIMFADCIPKLQKNDTSSQVVENPEGALNSGEYINPEENIAVYTPYSPVSSAPMPPPPAAPKFVVSTPDAPRSVVSTSDAPTPDASKPAASKPAASKPAASTPAADHSNPLSNLYEGYLKFTFPSSMQKDSTDEFRVEIVTSSILKDSILSASFFDETASPNYNVVIEKEKKLGRIMSMDLIEEDPENHNFKIVPINTKEQLVDKDGLTSWLWRVTPIKPGTHTLIVRAKIKVMDKDLKFVGYKDLEVKRKVITVKVVENNDLRLGSAIAGKQSANKYYWLLALPIIVFLVWFAFRKKRKQQKEQLIPIAEFDVFESTFLGLISNNNIEKAFAALKDLLKKYADSKLTKELVLLKSNYQNNVSRNNKNLIDDNEFNTNRAKIVDELINMIDRLKKEES